LVTRSSGFSKRSRRRLMFGLSCSVLTTWFRELCSLSLVHLHFHRGVEQFNRERRYSSLHFFWPSKRKKSLATFGVFPYKPCLSARRLLIIVASLPGSTREKVMRYFFFFTLC
jgi:hypothetical protein